MTNPAGMHVASLNPMVWLECGPFFLPFVTTFPLPATNENISDQYRLSDNFFRQKPELIYPKRHSLSRTKEI